MLSVAICCEAAETCPIGVDDADLVAGLRFKYLTGENDLSL